MARKPISSAAELAALATLYQKANGMPTGAQRGFPAPRDGTQQPESDSVPSSPILRDAEPLRLPAPRAGVYTQAEIAELLDVSVNTVRSWACSGCKVNGERVKLRTLRYPRGKVAPAALRAFLEAVNGIEVRIGRRDTEDEMVERRLQM